ALHGRGVRQRRALPLLLRPRRRASDQVRAGRRREFAAFIAAAGLDMDDMPDPQGDESFVASRIEALSALDARQRAMRAFSKEAIAARRRIVLPLLADDA